MLTVIGVIFLENLAYNLYLLHNLHIDLQEFVL